LRSYLELLPAKEYLKKDEAENKTGRLKIVDRHGGTKFLPEGDNSDPYDIYLNRSDWWKLVDENLLDPFNTALDKNKIEVDWAVYCNLLSQVKVPHEELKDKYHCKTSSFYGIAEEVKDGTIPEAHRTQETVLWEEALVSGEVGKRLSEPKMNDGRLDLSEMSSTRTIKDKLSPEEQAWELKGDDDVVYGWIGLRFSLRDACENGDGTVPVCAGQIFHKNIQERLSVPVCHEPAYRHPLSQAFTLRSVIKITQQVTEDNEMVYEE
jgi:hypothetical protein